MNKPEKKDLKEIWCKRKPLGEDNFKEDIEYERAVGYNHCHEEYEKYIRSIGGIVECRLLHEEGCQCENDE